MAELASLIAAYQASQITGSATNTDSWTSMFGSNQVQNIRDPELRARLIRVLSLDSAVTDYRQGDSDYRKNVRQTIPNDIQEAIRNRCGEVAAANDLSIASLPSTYDLVLPLAEAAAVAARPSKPGQRPQLASRRHRFAALLIRGLRANAQDIGHGDRKKR